MKVLNLAQKLHLTVLKERLESEQLGKLYVKMASGAVDPLIVVFISTVFLLLLYKLKIFQTVSYSYCSEWNVRLFQ